MGGSSEKAPQFCTRLSLNVILRKMYVTQIQAGDGMLLKKLRLPAVADTPEAFGSTLEEEQRYSDEDWHAAAIADAEGDRSVGFLGFVGEQACGIAGGFLCEEVRGDAYLCAMWVDPAQRRRGLGQLLVNAVKEWALSRGASTLKLWVTDSNSAAVAFYRSLGFEPTDESKPLRSNPQLLETLYQMSLFAA